MSLILREIKGGRYLGRQATRPGSAHPSRPPASEAPPHLSAYIGSPMGPILTDQSDGRMVTLMGPPCYLPSR